MRAPPPVRVETLPTRAWRVALATIVAAAVAVPVGWALTWPGADPVVQVVAALCCGAIAFVAAWHSCGMRLGGERTLCWNGQDWLLQDAASRGLDERGDVSLMLDLGPWMLVLFVPFVPFVAVAPVASPAPAHTRRRGSFRAATWLPLTTTPDHARWSALRAALWTWRASATERPWPR